MPISRGIVLADGRRPPADGSDTRGTLAYTDRRSPLHRTLEILRSLGVDDVTVVIGHRGDEVRAALAGYARRVNVVESTDWRRGSGISLLAAAGALVDRCLCILGDHPVHEDALAPLVALAADAKECVMLIDPRGEGDGDVTGVTKVKVTGGVVVDVGADLVEYDGYDCGHALVSPAILGAIGRVQHPSVADGLWALAQRGLVVAHESGRRRTRRFTDRATRDLRKDATSRHVEGLLDSKDGRCVLLSPGPVNTSARVKSALVHHDVSHRDSDYSEVVVRVSRKLRRVFRGGPEHGVVLVTGSGTAAMECAIASTVPAGKKILCIENGAFGERMWEIANLHHLDAVRLRYSPGEVARAADVRRALQANPDIAVVALCHHETSVGLLNPVEAIGAACRAHDVLFLVDAVSSLGAEDLDVVRDGIDVCWASGNKCLHGVAGVSFLCVSPRVWPRIENVPPRVYYLNLRRYRRASTHLAQTPFTPAVAAYFALDAACDEYLDDGARKRQALYASRNRLLRDGLRALGLSLFVDGAHAAHSIVTPRLPDGVEFSVLYEALKSAGFVIYDCKPPLQGRYFQIANMGVLPDGHLEAFLEAFATALEASARPAMRKKLA